MFFVRSKMLPLREMRLRARSSAVLLNPFYEEKISTRIKDARLKVKHIR